LEILISIIEWIIRHPILSIVILLIEYIIVMKLYYGGQRQLAKIGAILFVPQDALVNWFALTPLFMEFPQETLVTKRLKRWKTLPKGSKGFKGMRSKFSWFMCDILNKYDAGHC